MSDTATIPTPAEMPKKVKTPRKVLQTLFANEAEVLKEIETREKDPRRGFKTTFNGKTHWVVANNEGRAGGVAFMEHGGIVEELGRTKRAPKALGVDAIMAAINALPEDTVPKEKRHAILEQFKKLQKKS